MFAAFFRLTVFVVFIMCLPVVHAATATWNGSAAGHQEWMFPANWTPAVVPAGGELIFPATGNQKINTNDVAAATTFGPISITGSGYTITGNSITLNGGLSLFGSSATATLSTPLILNNSQVFYVESSAGLLQLSGVISGAGGFTKFGPGAVIITLNPTATGLFKIDGGAIDLRATLASQIQIGKGALAGTGSVGGIQSLGLGAAISPGALGTAGIGTLTSTNNVTLTSADSVYFNLGTNATDKLVVQGTCNFGNAQLLISHLAALNGLNENVDYEFIANDGTDIVQFGVSLDTWLLSDFTINGVAYQMSRVAGTGNDVTIRRVVATTSTTALAVTPGPTVAGALVTLEATVSSTLGIPNGGTVTFYDNFTQIGTPMLVNNFTGQASVSTTALLSGSHNLRAVFNGDNAGSILARSQSNVVSHTVTGTVTSVSLGVVTNGAGATLSGTVTNGIASTGTVNIYQNSVLIGSATLDVSRNYSFTTAALNAGAYAFVVEYPAQGTTAYDTSPTVNYNVPGGTSTGTTVISSLNPANVGTLVTFTASVTGATSGNVSFYDGAAVIGNGAVDGAGTATFATSALTTGVRSIKAKFNGSATHISSTSPAISQTMNGPSPSGSSPSTVTETQSTSACGLGSGFATMLLMMWFLFRLRLFARD